MPGRKSVIKRETQETKIYLSLNLDGGGKYEIKTGIKMLDHLLSQTAKHGRLDLSIKASGDDEHHVAEDIAICLGKALNEALGEKLGITRMADATVPMDDMPWRWWPSTSADGVIASWIFLLKRTICEVSTPIW